MKTKIFLFTALFSLFGLYAGAQDISYSVRRIWGDGSRHCAFTSLVKFQGMYYCTFREGYNHVFNEKGEADGKIRVIRSKDGDKWESVLLLARDGYDLRDPKLSVTPKGKLMLNMGCSLYKNQKLISQESFISFSKDGDKFTPIKKIKAEMLGGQKYLWLWRVTWHKGLGYGVTYYGEGNDKTVALLTTKDGKNYREMKTFNLPDFPNEATVRFTPDNRLLIFVRRDGGSRSTILLSADKPYTEWSQKDLKFHTGGPDALCLADGRVILGGRSQYIPRHAKTVVYTGNAGGDFCESLVLPSGGDCSYPSLLVVGDELWITYYSSHETSKPSIFLAKVPLKYFQLK